MIIRYQYPKTKQHEQELAACSRMVETEECWHRETLERHSTPQDYYQPYMSTALGREFTTIVARLQPHLRILDVGAGRGETSIYLASKGHEVHAVEPSPEFCEIINFMAEKFGRKIVIHNCAAEHLNQVDEVFDLVIFNVSLHHCDDPALALRNCYQVLRRGGEILIINEPTLPFFQSQKAFFKKLEHTPEAHYGGNEHSYHFPQYVRMIKSAGFSETRSTIHSRYGSLALQKQSLADDPNKRPTHKLLKRIYLSSTYFVIKMRLVTFPILALMKRCSLFQVTFVASKP